jgi:hypothetical protein
MSSTYSKPASGRIGTGDDTWAGGFRGQHRESIAGGHDRGEHRAARAYPARQDSGAEDHHRNQQFAAARDVEPTNAAEQVRHALAMLSASVFPHTAAIAGEMATYGNERHYELVLEQLLTGIRATTRLEDPAN